MADPGEALPLGMPPFRIQYRNVRSSQIVEREIQRKVMELWKMCSDIISCRIVVESASKRHHKGNPFQITLRVEVPGPDLVVSRHHPLHRSHEGVHAAIQDAFDAMARQVEDFTRLRKHKVKRHRSVSRGVVSAVFPEMDSGRIRNLEGGELYFHRNSMKSGDFGKLIPGTPVQFGEEVGEQGPQAVYVKVAKP